MSDGSGFDHETLPIACDLHSLSDRQKERHRFLLQKLREDFREVRELPEGYAFCFPAEYSRLIAVAEFVALERLCCPFFDFRIEVGHGAGVIWLEITGEGEARQVIREELIPSG